MCAFQMLEKHVDNVEECTMKESCTVASAVKSAWCSVLQLTEADGMPAWCFSDNEPTAVKVGRDLNMGSLRCEPHIFGIMVRRIIFQLKDDDQAAGGRKKLPKGPHHPAFVSPDMIKHAYCDLVANLRLWREVRTQMF